MYLLDTNVLSEMRKQENGRIDRQVAAWVLSVPERSLVVSVITILEIEQGILLVARRDAVQGAILRRWLGSHLLPAFNDRIFPST